MTHNLTYLFGNNFENETSAGVVSIPAKVAPETARGAVPAVFIQAADVVAALTVPANAIIKNFYVIVEEAMTGTATITLDDGSDTAVNIAIDLTAVGITKCTLSDVYTTTPYAIETLFSATQTGGSLKIAYDYIQLDTNTAKYINS